MLSAGAVRARWRQFQRSGNTGDVRVGVAATFTADTLAPLVGGSLLEHGVEAELVLAPFNQLWQVCLDPQGILGKCDAIVLAWRIEDIMEAEAIAFLSGEEGAGARVLEKVSALAEAVTSLRAAQAGAIVLAVPAVPVTLPAHLQELQAGQGLGALHRLVCSAWLEKLAGVAGSFWWDLDAVQRETGWSASADFRQWYLYRQPFSESFLLQAAQLLARVLRARVQPPRKCVVLDGDNTLWGGIVGEDGIEGVQLGDDFPGSAYRDFQRLLQQWRKTGTLLAIASKNNAAEVWELFAKHSGMVLQPTDFAAFRIDWNDKAANLSALARELNLGLDSFVFVDDNPIEIEFVRQALPEVLGVLLPEDPAEILPTLRALPCFDRLEVTREDRARADMMQAEQQRQTLAAAGTREDFLRALQLQVRFFAAGDGELGRVAQLINKTNQFNLTTRRRTAEEVRALAASPAHRVYAVEVGDRFGSYGLTGVVIAERRPQEQAWRVDTFLLSCRVLGRQVETALLAGLAAEAAADGARELHASFIPTAKNAPAADFLPRHGFVEEGGKWSLPVTAAPPIDPAVQFERSRAEHGNAA